MTWIYMHLALCALMTWRLLLQIQLKEKTTLTEEDMNVRPLDRDADMTENSTGHTHFQSIRKPNTMAFSCTLWSVIWDFKTMMRQILQRSYSMKGYTTLKCDNRHVWEMWWVLFYRLGIRESYSDNIRIMLNCHNDWKRETTYDRSATLKCPGNGGWVATMS